MRHVLFRTVLSGYGYGGVTQTIQQFDSYIAAEMAIEALEKNQIDSKNILTTAIRLYEQ